MKRYAIGFILMLLAVSVFAIAVRAASVGPSNAGTGTSVSNPIDLSPWSNPSNITLGGGSYASASYGSSFDTDFLRGSNYGFSIPVGATINGITVSIGRKYSGLAACGDTVQLLKSSSLVGTQKNGPNWTLVEATETLGSASDLWGTTWTASEINNSGFGVSLWCSSATGSSGTGSVDFVQVTVSYTAGASPHSQVMLLGNTKTTLTSGTLIIP